MQVDLAEGTSYERLPELVRSGRIGEAQVDAAVAQVLALKFEGGCLRTRISTFAASRRETRTAADIVLARKAAEKALVRVKNDGTLPLGRARAITSMVSAFSKACAAPQAPTVSLSGAG
ncbi:MAG: hypothetical protein ABIT04_07565 [Novosphingobium sp.]